MIEEPLPTGAAKAAAVREMFDRIAPRYDALNRLFSLGLDQRWRRRALDLIEVGPSDRIIDLACGTGDLVELAETRGAQVVGVDFARQMLHGAQRRQTKARFVQCDGARLPFRTASATVVTCGFALRNFVSLPHVFVELARVLEPGGRVALIDVDRPRSSMLRIGHSLYFDRVVPWVGGVLSDRSAYRYLPRSTAYLPPAPELLRSIEAAGFSRSERSTLMGGAAQIITAVRAERT